MSCYHTLIPLREPVALDLPYNINQFECFISFRDRLQSKQADRVQCSVNGAVHIETCNSAHQIINWNPQLLAKLSGDKTS